MSKYEDAIQPKILYKTVFRIQKITGKPIRRGFDVVLNGILDDYEKLQRKSKKSLRK